MTSQAKIRKKKTLEKISLPNYSQRDTKTFRTSMHMEVVEDGEEDSKDKAPSENASTIVIATTPKSPDLKSPTKEPQPHGDENEGKFFRQPVPHARCFRFRGLLHEFKCLPIEKSIFVAAPSIDEKALPVSLDRG